MEFFSFLLRYTLKTVFDFDNIFSSADFDGTKLLPTDTYVKTYLRERDGEKWLQKRKTRVVRHSKNPQYRQTLKYNRCDILQGRHLLVMLWEKKQGFESNQGLGGAEVNLDLLPPKEFIFDWYPLFPIHTLGSHNADSPWWLREKWALEAGELDLRLSLLLKDEGESVVKIISWWKSWLITCWLAQDQRDLDLFETTAFLIIKSLNVVMRRTLFQKINQVCRWRSLSLSVLWFS